MSTVRAVRSEAREDPKRLRVPLESILKVASPTRRLFSHFVRPSISTVVGAGEEFVQLLLGSVTKRRVPQIVRQARGRYGLRVCVHVIVLAGKKPESRVYRRPDLLDLQAVRQPVVQDQLWSPKSNLCHTTETAKGLTVKNPISISMRLRSSGVVCLLTI